MGLPLAQAQGWLVKRSDDLPTAEREFIDLSLKRAAVARAKTRRVQTFIYVLLVGIIAGLVGWINQAYVNRNFPAILAVSLITMVLYTVKGLATYGQAVVMSRIGTRSP